MLKCVYTPTKKVIVVVGEEEITYYMLSAVDSYGDTSAFFYYQNDSWHVIFITGNFVDIETFYLRMADKQDVLVAGEGITISGNEISTKKYLHSTALECTGHFDGTIWVDIVIDKKEAFTDYRDLLQYFSKYKLSTGIVIYNDSTGETFNLFTEFLYDKNDESQEIDFTGYGVDEDNLVIVVRDNIIQLDRVSMRAYTPEELQ